MRAHSSYVDLEVELSQLVILLDLYRMHQRCETVLKHVCLRCEAVNRRSMKK